MKKTNRELIGIDIFAGAGGQSLGAKLSGITMRYAVERDQHAAASYKRNFEKATVLCEDIRKLSTEQLKAEPVFIIMGGPPCQGFSLSNTKTRDMSNPNNRMFEEFLRFVNDIKPTWFLFENVYGLTKFKNGEEEGKKLNLSTEEFAFYDAITKPEAVQDFYTNEQLVAITRELTDALRTNKTIDWTMKESARAGMRRIVKRLLKKYKYPPEGQEAALETIMTQCEMWSQNEFEQNCGGVV